MISDSHSSPESLAYPWPRHPRAAGGLLLAGRAQETDQVMQTAPTRSGLHLEGIRRGWLTVRRRRRRPGCRRRLGAASRPGFFRHQRHPQGGPRRQRRRLHPRGMNRRGHHHHGHRGKVRRETCRRWRSPKELRCPPSFCERLKDSRAYSRNAIVGWNTRLTKKTSLQMGGEKKRT